MRRAGGRIVFDPRAIVYHYNRPGFANLLRRNYRWGFSAIESKAPTRAARQAWVYRHPGLLVACSLPLALGSTVYIVGCWLKARAIEPLVMLPGGPGGPAGLLGRPRVGRAPLDPRRRQGRRDAAPLGMTAPPGLTIALCTHDRPALLARALESVVGQAPAPDEVMVVDNAPTDGAVRELVEQRFPGVRYVVEPVPGLDFARNRALAEAGRDIVAFLDDDAVAAPGWADALRRNFADDAVVVCTGRVEPLALETEGQRLFEANGGFSRGSARVRLPDDAARPLHGRSAPLIAWAISVGCGCSYAVRRDAARALGGFDEALDLGTVLPGGGDHDLLWRALQSGGTRRLRAGCARVA